MDIGKEIVRIAKSYIGKTEKPGNAGFTDAEFEKKMTAVGWIKLQAWCSYFTELVWKEAYSGHPEILADLNRLFAASATATYKNFDLDPNWEVGPEPRIGAIAIWRHGIGWQGHAGIDTSLGANNKFATIEGNTNDMGGREGYIVDDKDTRKLNAPFTKTGLNLIGFIYPKAV